MLTRSRKAVSAALTTAAVGLALAVAGPADLASADPGFCGARAGVNAGAGAGDMIYTVRNRCGSGHNFKVFLPQSGRTSSCMGAPPYGYAYILMQWADENWQVQACS
ncbi:hypothetical protein ABT095_01955 [Kitasatospora sp. NPDC002227]|uniref:hypothetical protein n=1 Tax=Kitasatospora sp. NPDC002227 TaxID=3154773 RepID=UPI00331DD208